eukprot:gene302-2396_t
MAEQAHTPLASPIKASDDPCPALTAPDAAGSATLPQLSFNRMRDASCGTASDAASPSSPIAATDSEPGKRPREEEPGRCSPSPHPLPWRTSNEFAPNPPSPAAHPKPAIRAQSGAPEAKAAAPTLSGLPLCFATDDHLVLTRNCKLLSRNADPASSNLAKKMDQIRAMDRLHALIKDVTTFLATAPTLSPNQARDCIRNLDKIELQAQNASRDMLNDHINRLNSGTVMNESGGDHPLPNPVHFCTVYAVLVCPPSAQ